MNTDVRVTSELLWRATMIAVLIDVPLVILIRQRVPAGLFQRLKWQLVAAAFLVYAVLWGSLGSVFYWDAVYSYVFPA